MNVFFYLVLTPNGYRDKMKPVDMRLSYSFNWNEQVMLRPNPRCPELRGAANPESIKCTVAHKF